MQSIHEHPSWPSRQSIIWLVTAALLALAAACSWYGLEHQSHIARALTWALILACPLMHRFGHRPGGHRHPQGAASKPAASTKPEPP